MNINTWPAVYLRHNTMNINTWPAIYLRHKYVHINYWGEPERAPQRHVLNVHLCDAKSLFAFGPPGARARSSFCGVEHCAIM